jgi:hypothetical protein
VGREEREGKGGSSHVLGDICTETYVRTYSFAENRKRSRKSENFPHIFFPNSAAQNMDS